MTKPIIELEVISNAKVCTDCGGKCCRSQPGSAYPEDFGTSPMQILLNLTISFTSGFWCIDWWEGDARDGMDELPVTEFIRPAIVNHIGKIRHASWGGQCALWSERYGCSLPSPGNRPRECRMLEPHALADGSCVAADETSKQNAAIAWIPYRELIGIAEDAAGQILNH